jgi:hypothetical protein
MTISSLSQTKQIPQFNLVSLFVTRQEAASRASPGRRWGGGGGEHDGAGGDGAPGPRKCVGSRRMAAKSKASFRCLAAAPRALSFKTLAAAALLAVAAAALRCGCCLNGHSACCTALLLAALCGCCCCCCCCGRARERLLRRLLLALAKARTAAQEGSATALLRRRRRVVQGRNMVDHDAELLALVVPYLGHCKLEHTAGSEVVRVKFECCGRHQRR